MKLAFSIWVVLSFMAVAVGIAQPMLKFEGSILRVSGLPSQVESFFLNKTEGQWQSILSVYTRDAYLGKIDQPIAGKYNWEDDEIRFEPAFPFSPGQTYHAVFAAGAFYSASGLEGESKSEKMELSFSIPPDNSQSTIIEAVYPESSSLPENLLRMYIHFSTPMMPGEAYQRIHLLEEDGTKVDKAFLVIDQELWDYERKRFTLLFDPGRIKRDLKSNIDLGPPLLKGKKYQLVIDSAWRDVHGNNLASSIRKTFSVGKPVRERVDPRQWKIVLPPAGSFESVHISFDRPIDHALALKYITVNGPMGKVAGQQLMVNDYAFEFTPADPWVEGDYVISISPLLEDVAGNNLNNVFDLDLSKEARVNSLKSFDMRVRIQARPH